MLGLIGGKLTNREQLNVFTKDELIGMYIDYTHRSQKFIKEILNMSASEFVKFQKDCKLMLQVLELTKKDFNNVEVSKND